ncbi:hypothetical protein VNO78_22187 [Psophocarpus tetragonolobus]|uniref:Uncharacterized protein n=1 Tax=Psophocarpus tetragonolobus TaxID=3891 RepID=A0AAN9SDY8_PSOTE
MGLWIVKQTIERRYFGGGVVGGANEGLPWVGFRLGTTKVGWLGAKVAYSGGRDYGQLVVRGHGWGADEGLPWVGFRLGTTKMGWLGGRVACSGRRNFERLAVRHLIKEEEEEDVEEEE